MINNFIENQADIQLFGPSFVFPEVGCDRFQVRTKTEMGVPMEVKTACFQKP
jgi:hypothetical protein